MYFQHQSGAGIHIARDGDEMACAGGCIGWVGANAHHAIGGDDASGGGGGGGDATESIKPAVTPDGRRRITLLGDERQARSTVQKFFTHRPVSTFDRSPFQLMTGELFLYGMALIRPRWRRT